MTSSVTHNEVKETSVTSLHNPFSVQISHGKLSSLKDGLHLTISVSSASQVSVSWGVNIQTFQNELQLPSHDIMQRYNNEEMFNKEFIKVVNLGHFAPGTYTHMYVTCPEQLTEEFLGEPPRKLYPAVVVCKLNDCKLFAECTPIVLQLTVIHLKDQVCCLDSHIIYQFVKTNKDRVLSLQPIYMSNNGSDRDHISSSCADRKTTLGSSHGKCKGVEPPHSLLGHGTSQEQLETTPGSDRVCYTTSKNIKNTTESRCQRPELVHGDNINMSILGNQDKKMSNDDNKCNKGDFCEKYGELDIRSEIDLDDEVIPDTCSLSSSINNDGTRQLSGIKHDHTNISHESDSGSNSDLDDSDPCCVCQANSIYYTLLPCRHACVCSLCITKLDQCPICRAYIDSYFRLGDS